MERVTWLVSGKVQGVSFRKFTQRKARELGLLGWCRNTPDKLSVEGEIEGPTRAIDSMLEWLRMTGSPYSVIEKLEVISRTFVSDRKFKAFSIIRDYFVSSSCISYINTEWQGQVRRRRQRTPPLNPPTTQAWL
jgi:acylphosphatase